MTKYIDRYYLNWELYGIKFAEWPQPFDKLIENAVEDYHGTPALQTSRAWVSVIWDYIYMWRRSLWDVSLNSMLKSTYTSSVLSTNTTYKCRWVAVDQTWTYIYGSIYDWWRICAWTLSTEWDVSSLTMDVLNLNWHPRDVYCSPDWMKVRIATHYDDLIHEYTLDTPWTFVNSTSVSVRFWPNYTLSWCWWSPDWKYFFIISNVNTWTITQYEASTNWDITSIDTNNPVSTLTLTVEPRWFDISFDWTWFYVNTPIWDLYHYTW